MASDLDFVEYIVEQISDECGVSFKKMFGKGVAKNVVKINKNN